MIIQPAQAEMENNEVFKTIIIEKKLYTHPTLGFDVDLDNFLDYILSKYCYICDNYPEAIELERLEYHIIKEEKTLLEAIPKIEDKPKERFKL